jgi:hypothetical protein
MRKAKSSDDLMDMSFDECERRLRRATQIVFREMLLPFKRKAEKMPTEFPVIPLSDEQREILEQPADSRVHRILKTRRLKIRRTLFCA